MVEKVPMTAGGHTNLEAELKVLKHTERPAVIKAIEEARAHGDLSENAEYHAAKEQQGMIEGRIKMIVDSLSRSEIIDPKELSGTKVLFASTVTIADEDDKENTYQIVGVDEVDVTAGKISFSSPIGRALIGRNIGDEVEVKTPGGDTYYEIVKIEFI
ncbi:MAG: transcription elongation factor GreA [Kordiimonadaceae bacterium]|jgi:transcription elongation factor GreA|nr:transcription elongation factor GreA [Kordiimonadaceae bacterium]MBT6036542.1 transcription elongation factor GreA [Kordiimonadaceae bacterium]MBT6330452.1 transcription elongation factor GreA [Kordiimonadaceae bacterium]MBT7581792.1 transcription elongation factor GreA [Kordiimonadaceae bacterium]